MRISVGKRWFRSPGRLGLYALSGALLLVCTSASAFDTITVGIGHGTAGAKLVRFNLAESGHRRYSGSDGWHWASYWEADLGYWYLERKSVGPERLLEIGFTPNARRVRDVPFSWGGRPYLEGGIGVHLLSAVHLGERDLSSTFQFGSHIGFGFLFGERERSDLCLRIEHLSNAGIKAPNPGINFTVIRFSYHL